MNLLPAVPQVPISANSVFNRTLDNFLGRRKSLTKDGKHPIRDAKDIAGLVIWFAIAYVRQGRTKMSDIEGLNECAELLAQMLVERGYHDIRNIDSLWGQWRILRDRNEWTGDEFVDIWSALRVAEEPSLADKRIPVDEAA